MMNIVETDNVEVLKLMDTTASSALPPEGARHLNSSYALSSQPVSSESAVMSQTGITISLCQSLSAAECVGVQLLIAIGLIVFCLDIRCNIKLQKLNNIVCCRNQKRKSLIDTENAKLSF